MSSHDYWKAREENNLRHYEEQEQGYNRKVDDLYQSMIDECSRDIEAFYAKYAKEEGITLAEAKRRASKLDIEAYGRKAKRYVKEKNFSPQANEEMKLYNMTMKVNRLELLKSELSLEMTACADATDKYYSEIFDERAREAYERQAGVLGKTVPDEKTMDRMADNLVHGSFQNPTIDGSYTTFSERIWVNQDALRSAVMTELTRGIIRGLNPRELARSLNKKMKAGRYNAERLMRTELARVQIGAQQQAISDAGYDSYEFIATEGAHTCDVCRSLDGKKFKLRKMVVGENAPPMHPFCRCSVCAAMSDEEFKELTGVDPVKMDLKAINQAAVEKYKNDEKSSARYNKRGDPIFDIFGPAKKSHPKEIERITDEAKRLGVEIRKTQNDEKAKMAYSPGLHKGEPGQLIVSDEDSIGAWLHEEQHMLDDAEDGFLGFAAEL
jgi:SPP1 gp7 family putative phage head morphogenesis protein